MENTEIQEIKERIRLSYSSDKSNYPAESLKLEKLLELKKEQYLEIELGLQQIERKEIIDGESFLNSLKES